MAKRRGNNEGSIYKRSNGTWRAQINLNGRRLSFSAKTKTECQQWIRKTTHQVDQGFTLKGADIKLKDFLKDWLITLKASRSKGTVRIYSSYVKLDIMPILGKHTLASITPDMVQRMYDQQLAAGKSNHHVHHLHKITNVAMNHALKLRLIPRNPCQGTTPPKLTHKEMKFYDETQVHQLLDTALAIEDPYYPIYFLAIHTGMRQGELLGLKWEDIDLDRRILQVKRQCVRCTDYSFEFSKPKSKSGIRSIILGQQAVEVLKAQKIHVQEMQQKARDEWEEYDLVFPNLTGKPILSKYLRRRFYLLLKEAGLPKIRFHDLRHTAATLMLNNGIPVIVVSRRLGHSKPSITLDVYGHLIPNKQEEVATLMDQIMSPIASESTLAAPDLHQDQNRVVSKTENIGIYGGIRQ